MGGMRNVQDNFETCKQSFISAFSIYMTVPLVLLFNFCFPSFDYL